MRDALASRGDARGELARLAAGAARDPAPRPASQARVAVPFGFAYQNMMAAGQAAGKAASSTWEEPSASGWSRLGMTSSLANSSG